MEARPLLQSTERAPVLVDTKAHSRALLWMYGVTVVYLVFAFVIGLIIMYHPNLGTEIGFGIMMGLVVLIWAYIEAEHGEALMRKQRTYLRMIGTSLISTGSIAVLLAIFKPGIVFYYSVLSQVLISGTVLVVFFVVLRYGIKPKLQRYLL